MQVTEGFIFYLTYVILDGEETIGTANKELKTMSDRISDFVNFINILTQFDAADDPVFCIQPLHEVEKTKEFRRFADFYRVSDVEEAYADCLALNKQRFCCSPAINEMAPDSEGKLRRRKANTVRVRGFCIDFDCLLYTSPSPRDATLSRMPSSA